MKYLVIDTESTGGLRESHGSALDPRNRLVYIGYATDSDSDALAIEYEVGKPYGRMVAHLQSLIAECDILVFFNAKHDLHWLRRYNINFLEKRLWDIQQAEFIINGQETPFPNLGDTAIRYGFSAGKSDILGDYRKRGIDTDGVPEDELREYVRQDILGTKQAFLGQLTYLQKYPSLETFIWVACQDEFITQEMEWNGLKFDFKGLQSTAEKLESRILEIDNALYKLTTGSMDSNDRVSNGISVNWDSPIQVSAVLYGGEIIYEVLEPYLFTYKNDKKPPVTKTRWVEKSIQFPRLVEPLPRTELKNGGFSTDDKTLRQLKGVAKAKEIIDLVLERRGTQTQINRYFRGIPKIYDAMGWQDEIVHGQLHHVVADTGRLSSSNPNVQNIDERARRCLVTRFKTLPSK